MKKIINILFIGLMIVGLSGCNLFSKNDFNDSDSLQSSMWSSIYETDDFGDIKYDSEIYISGSTIGQYSDSSSSGGEFTCDILMYYNNVADNYAIQFKILKNGKIAPTFSEDDELYIKTKIGKEQKEFKLLGLSLLGKDDLGGDYIYKNLYLGNDVECIIYIRDEKYKMTLEGNGFEEACDSAWDKIEALADANEINSVKEALEATFASEKYGDRYQYFDENKDSFKSMTTDEINKIIENYWLRITIDQFAYDDWWVFEYKDDIGTQIGRFEDGNYELTGEHKYGYHVENNIVYLEGYPTGGDPLTDWDGYEWKKLQEGYYLAVQVKGEGTYDRTTDSYIDKMYLYVEYDENGNPKYSIDK